MQVFILLCFIAGVFAANDCPENSHYNSCGTACPLTCVNYKDPPLTCIRICVPGCHCDEGYVKNEDDECVLPDECDTSCLAQPDEGMCRGSFPMYYYDAKAGECKKFIYGGCGGNGNRYKSEENCLEKCGDVKVWESNSDVCDLPLESGPCMALFHRYGFSKKTGKCEKFLYGGCRGNKNNFESLQDCELKCQAAYAERDEGPFACDQEKEIGPCKAKLPRFFFNKATGKCEEFIYGGCGGNSNNFIDEEDCEAVCVA